MDQIWVFIKSLSWRDWIAIAGLIVLPLSALNAFISLRTRYRDWHGTQSKKKFDTRLEQLKKELTLVQASRNVLPTFFLYVLNQGLVIAGLTLSALILFIAAYAMYRIPYLNLRVPELLYLGLAVIALLLAGNDLKKLTTFVGKVYNPKKLGIEILDFIYAGRRKGFIKHDREFVQSLFKNTALFGEDERIQLFSHADTLERQLPSDKQDTSPLI